MILQKKKASCYFRKVSTAIVNEDFEGINFNVDSVILSMLHLSVSVINSFNEVDRMNYPHSLCQACIHLWQHHVHTDVWIKLGLFIFTLGHNNKLLNTLKYGC